MHNGFDYVETKLQQSQYLVLNITPFFPTVHFCEKIKIPMYCC